MTSLIDIIEQLDNVDDPDAGEMAKSNHALAAAMSMWRPVNWHGSGLTPDQILRVASENGIPVAWVPPTAVLVELAATEQAGRIGVLVARQHEVLDHCESLIAQCRGPELSDVQTLAGEALQALKAGHHAAAMALAVAVAEGPALWASERRVESFRTQQEEDKYKESLKFKYELAKEELESLKSGDHRSRLNVMRLALLAPIPKFFTRYHADSGDPIPETVSRHATVHQPTVTHLSRENALLSVMLCASLLCEQQSWIDEVRDF